MAGDNGNPFDGKSEANKGNKDEGH